MIEFSETHPCKVLRFCPCCGSPKFVFDGNRSFRCAQCHFNFYINSSAAVASVIVDDGGRILFTVRAHEPMKGYLDLPGGFVDPMESAETALVREIKEELGLEVIDYAFLGSFPNEYPFSGLSVFTTDLGFYTKVKSLNGIKADDDISAFVFLHPSQIEWAQIGSNSIVKIVKQYLLSVGQ
jgi:NAD+ diphosphatase